MSLNIIIAAALFLLTSLMGYIIWYILFGIKKKEKKGGESPKEAKAPKESTYESKTIPRSSYCYPKMNDVMGYDFVDVVKVPEELLNNKPKTVEDSFAEAKPAGITAVTNEQDGGPEGDIYEPTAPVKEKPHTEKAPSNEQKKEEFEVADGYTVVNTETELDPEEISALNMMGGDWNHRDYDQAMDDEMLNAIMDNNAGDIEQADFTEEDLRIAREKEEMERFDELEKLLNTKNNETEDDIKEFSRLFPDNKNNTKDEH